MKRNGKTVNAKLYRAGKTYAYAGRVHHEYQAAFGRALGATLVAALGAGVLEVGRRPELWGWSVRGYVRDALWQGLTGEDRLGAVEEEIWAAREGGGYTHSPGHDEAFLAAPHRVAEVTERAARGQAARQGLPDCVASAEAGTFFVYVPDGAGWLADGYAETRKQETTS